MFTLVPGGCLVKMRKLKARVKVLIDKREAAALEYEKMGKQHRDFVAKREKVFTALACEPPIDRDHPFRTVGKMSLQAYQARVKKLLKERTERIVKRKHLVQKPLFQMKKARFAVAKHMNGIAEKIEESLKELEKVSNSKACQEELDAVNAWVSKWEQERVAYHRSLQARVASAKATARPAPGRGGRAGGRASRGRGQVRAMPSGGVAEPQADRSPSPSPLEEPEASTTSPATAWKFTQSTPPTVEVHRPPVKALPNFETLSVTSFEGPWNVNCGPLVARTTVTRDGIFDVYEQEGQGWTALNRRIVPDAEARTFFTDIDYHKWKMVSASFGANRDIVTWECNDLPLSIWERRRGGPARSKAKAKGAAAKAKAQPMLDNPAGPSPGNASNAADWYTVIRDGRLVWVNGAAVQETNEGQQRHKSKMQF